MQFLSYIEEDIILNQPLAQKLGYIKINAYYQKNIGSYFLMDG